MNPSIIESQPPTPEWLAKWGQPVASRLLAWEQAQTDALLTDVFGYHAVQLGCPALQALRSNRMPHRWYAQLEFESPSPTPAPGPNPVKVAVPVVTSDPLAPCAWVADGPRQTEGPHVWLDSRAWPWQADSLDLVVMPHTLEMSSDPHACLREVARVLIPEGQLLITGLNPYSLWGLKAWHPGQRERLASPSLIAYRRMRDWLRLLGFEVQVSRFGGWTPALGSERWMQRLQWLDGMGERWWPILGGVYLLMATKRVPGGRLLASRSWRTLRTAAPATAPVARTDTSNVSHLNQKECFEPR
jgi:SAM-dependent methyltransferase